MAKGPALAALAGYYSKAQTAEDRYRLVVSVNDQELARLDVAGSAEGKTIAVPRKTLQPAGENVVRFHIDGRGTVGYAITLTAFTRDFAPDQNRLNRTAVLHRRIYTPADPEFEGKPLPTGFGVAVGATYFENVLTQLPVGGRAASGSKRIASRPPGSPRGNAISSSCRSTCPPARRSWKGRSSRRPRITRWPTAC